MCTKARRRVVAGVREERVLKRDHIRVRGVPVVRCLGALLKIGCARVRGWVRDWVRSLWPEARGCAVRWISLQVRDWLRERTLAHPILRGILGARGSAGVRYWVPWCAEGARPPDLSGRAPWSTTLRAS